MEVASLRELRTRTFLLIFYATATSHSIDFYGNAFERTPAISTFDQYRTLCLSRPSVFHGEKKRRIFLGSNDVGLNESRVAFRKKKNSIVGKDPRRTRYANLV